MLRALIKPKVDLPDYFHRLETFKERKYFDVLMAQVSDANYLGDYMVRGLAMRRAVKLSLIFTLGCVCRNLIRFQSNLQRCLSRTHAESALT